MSCSGDARTELRLRRVGLYMKPAYGDHSDEGRRLRERAWAIQDQLRALEEAEMSVQDPGTLQVQCDECMAEEDFDCTEFVGSPPSFGVSDETITDKGWTSDGDLHYCPKCSEANAESIFPADRQPKPKRKRKGRKR
jgi:hypothetical protein